MQLILLETFFLAGPVILFGNSDSGKSSTVKNHVCTFTLNFLFCQVFFFVFFSNNAGFNPFHRLCFIILSVWAWGLVSLDLSPFIKLALFRDNTHTHTHIHYTPRTDAMPGESTKPPWGVVYSLWHIHTPPNALRLCCSVTKRACTVCNDRFIWGAICPEAALSGPLVLSPPPPPH